MAVPREPKLFIQPDVYENGKGCDIYWEVKDDNYRYKLSMDGVSKYHKD